MQERIAGLRLTQMGQDSNAPVIILWEVDAGSHILWTATMSPGPSDLATNRVGTSGYRWESDNKGVLGSTILTINITAANDINNLTISESYEITTAISGFTATASTDNTTTGTVITYSVSCAGGSDVNVTLIYQDGDVDSQQYPGDWSGTKTFTHAFQDGGNFHVEVGI